MLAPVLLSLPLLSAGSVAVQSTPFERPGPGGNVLVVLLDDVGRADADEMVATAHGAGIGSTTLDLLAANGITYARAYANPVCSPSRRSLVFSQWYFAESGVGCVPFAGAPGDALTSLAEVFDPFGATMLAGKWHLGQDPLGGPWEGAPGRHGFTKWHGIPGNINLGACGGTSYSNWYRVDADGASVNSSGIVTTFNPLDVEQALTAWWQATSGRKLAYWSMSYAHAPFQTPPASVKMPGYPLPLSGQRSQFLAMIAACDHQLGRFLTTVGFDFGTDIVILAGDNGTPASVAPDPNRAKETTFQRGVRIPLILAGGGLGAARSNRLVHLTDVLPTVCDYVGVPPPAGIDGISLVSGAPHPHVLVGQSGGWFGGDPTVPGDWAAVGAFAGGRYYKLRRTGLPNGVITEELYDLVADPDETHPLAPASHPTVSNYLRNKLLLSGVP